MTASHGGRCLAYRCARRGAAYAASDGTAARNGQPKTVPGGIGDAHDQPEWHLICIRRIVGPEPQSIGALVELLQDVVHGVIVGSVQLERCAKENGRHRAEVQKLFVLSSRRGRGIAARLMQALEAFAAGAGCRLLVLDTLSDSAAASVYRHLGWTFAGSIPAYAATPDGDLHATSYFYKQLP